MWLGRQGDPGRARDGHGPCGSTTARRSAAPSCSSAWAGAPGWASSAVDTVGLDPSAKAIEVDEWMRAGDGLWAVGDVTGVGPFTHMAMYQAGIAIDDILGRRGQPADYRGSPG